MTVCLFLFNLLAIVLRKREDFKFAIFYAIILYFCSSDVNTQICPVIY